MYVMDFWGKWKIMCSSVLSAEDIDNVYIIGSIIAGFLLIGLDGV